MLYKSAIFFLHIELKHSILAQLDGFYSIYSIFSHKTKIIEKNKKVYIFYVKKFFFFKELKIRDSSSVGLLILRHFM